VENEVQDGYQQSMSKYFLLTFNYIILEEIVDS